MAVQIITALPSVRQWDSNMSVSKIVAAAASGVGGAGLRIEDVFSTFVYTGTGSSRSINNGIDLSGEGGLTWFKERDGTSQHALFDTERGVLKGLASSSMAQEATETGSVTAFNNKLMFRTFLQHSIGTAVHTQIESAITTGPHTAQCNA